jgi:PAS domain S-box-containing protein
MVMPQSFISRDQFQRSIWRAVIPSLLLLVAQAAFLAVLLFYWWHSAERSRQSDRVIADANDVERLLANMETGTRGYMLTGDQQFLQPYEAAHPQVRPAISDLQNEVADNQAQVSRLAKIASTLSSWEKLREQAAGASLSPPANPEQLRIMRERKTLMDDMRQSIREIIIAENELKSSRDSRESRAAGLVVLGGIGLSVMIGLGLAWVNRWSIGKLVSTYQNAIDAQAAANTQFGGLVEAIPQLVWIADGDGKYTYFNKPWSDFVGSTSEQLLADGWKSVFHEDDFGPAAARWNESVATGKPFEGEFRLKQAADGSYRWFLCRATPLLDHYGKRIRWFGTCTDIESQKQLEKQKETTLAAERAARSDLLRASKVKDEFLATLSHELRTPMSAILGWARLLRDPVVRDKSLDKGLEAIDNNARAQARLIDDLLDMSRIISGKVVLKREAVNLPQVIELAVESVRPAVANKQIALDLRLPAQREIVVPGDPARLQQVVWNLLTNAVKFTPRQGRVSVELERSDSGARITVTDSGQGIDPRFLPYVFDRFRQADASITRTQGGLGLGLAIVKNLVELHGGTVSATSDGEGRGSSFTVLLPLGREPLVPIAGQKDGDGEKDAAVLRGKRVLIVEDDPATAQVVSAILEHFGMHPKTAGSGAQALDLLNSDGFDLLISDLGMPEMDGYTLIRMLRSREEIDGRPRLRAIALSAFARKEDRSQTADAGYDLHLAKPASPEELLQAVSSLLA